ncbi:MAG: alpha-mannosidase [Phormidium tanganyikae FI6-MK23]|jgi:alpha-mannosidase|nr:alpha-mannosidase [Phormidium tanganyikae FI6-MK23]
MADVLAASFVERLRNLVQADAIEHWSVCEDCAIEDISTQSFTKIELNEKRYLVWEKGQKVRWFYQEFVLPEALNDYPLAGLTLRLALTWWAEFAEVYVNGEKVQEGDLFDHSCRIILSSNVISDEKVAVAIRLVSPGHDIGGLMRSRLIYESDYNEIDPGFVADELEVIQSYVDAFELEKIETEFDWLVSDRQRFHQSLESLRNSLLPLSSQIKQHTIFLLGHAHLDMAWLWDVEETWRSAERTFVSVLNLQKDYPELTFCHTTPALFEWIEQNRPEIFSQIQAQVKAGKWEIVGGMWIEPEMNLINAESIARHLLYGQRYCQEKFGEICRVAWLPDTFGFNWQTPQLLKLAGIDYFVTQKLRWNDTTQFPYEWFNWQAPNGSQVKSLMSSPIGEGIEPTKMAKFTWDWVKKTGQPNPLWLFGVGDHGGGPTRDMLEIAERWKRSPFFPKLEFTTALNYLESLEAPKDTWNDELYLEFHRGCYTTHGDQKRFNRNAEAQLYSEEMRASLSEALIETDYFKTEFEAAWKILLFNQFHDILPGSSIQQVYQTASINHLNFEKILDFVHGFAKIELEIAASVRPHPEARLVVVSNSVNWERSGLAKANVVKPDSNEPNWEVCDLNGKEIAVGVEKSWHTRAKSYIYEHFFQAENIPSVGYRCFWVYPSKDLLANAESTSKPDDFVLENTFIKAIVDPETGNLSSIFDKIHDHEILNGLGNELQAFQDSGQYWDAWNIDPNYAEHPLESVKLLEINYQKWQSLIPAIEVRRAFRESTFKQWYYLEPDSPILKIYTLANWKERHVLLKAAFPLNLEADFATYEIAGGAIDRTLRPKTQAELAKWEVPALGWMDINDGEYGVSVLSDCKHGYDCQPNQVRLTLLRGSEFPDPSADLGQHEFTYALYPHSEDWRAAQTTRKAYELLQPLQTVTLAYPSENGTLPPVHSFLDLQSENLILSSLKQSEDNPDEYILRCYECHGEPAELNLKGDFEIIESLDLLERPIDIPNQIQPWELRTYKIKKRASSDTL